MQILRDNYFVKTFNQRKYIQGVCPKNEIVLTPKVQGPK